MYGGELCDSIIINIPSLHFFFHIPVLIVGIAQCHRHCPYKRCSWCVSPVNSKVERQYKHTLDYFPEFLYFRSIAHELVVEVSRC